MQATFTTGSTCGEACWRALEDVCRCSCGGRNHGCDRNGERPFRTCTVKGRTYRVVAIVSDDRTVNRGGGWYDARMTAAHLAESLPRGAFGYEPTFERRASESAMKWAELEPYRDDSDRPYLIWCRDDAATYLAEMANAPVGA